MVSIAIDTPFIVDPLPISFSYEEKGLGLTPKRNGVPEDFIFEYYLFMIEIVWPSRNSFVQR